MGAARPRPGEPGWDGSCPHCGRRPRTAAAAHRLRPDLTVTWLLPGAAGLVVCGFCQDCAPRGPIAEVACVYCGDGPLLAGELASVDPVVDQRVARWLSSNGWQLDPCPACPRCCGRFRPAVPR